MRQWPILADYGRTILSTFKDGLASNNKLATKNEHVLCTYYCAEGTTFQQQLPDYLVECLFMFQAYIEVRIQDYIKQRNIILCCQRKRTP